MSRARLLWVLPLVVLAGCEGCELVTGPAFQARRALHAAAAHLGEAGGPNVRFVTSGVEVEGDRARVYARGELDGAYRGVPTRALSTEVVPLVRGPDGWRVDGFPLPRLAGVVDALEGRLRAFGAGDAEAYLALVHPDYREGETDRRALEVRLRRLLAGGAAQETVVSWAIRIDRGEAVVTETYRLELPGVDRAEAREGRARYTLRQDGARWRFTSGLM